MNENREYKIPERGVSAFRMKPRAPNMVVERLDVALDVCTSNAKTHLPKMDCHFSHLGGAPCQARIFDNMLRLHSADPSFVSILQE